VAPDDLNAPLGQQKPKPPRRIPLPQAIAGVLAASGLVIVGWAAFVNDPLGGEPVAVVSLKAPAEAGRRHDGATSEPAPARPEKTAEQPQQQTLPSAKTITIIDGSNGNRQDIVIPDQPAKSGKPEPHSSLAPVNPALLEMTKDGAIPKIGADGVRPASAYAIPRTFAASVRDFPKIAMVIGGMGISASGTADAFALPAAMTFAVSPYAADADRLAQRARSEGHEVLLQVPMEPYDYPDNDPGPQTLLTSVTPEMNVARLHWLMSRMQGYVGISGYMGARFTASEQALRPVLTDAAKRGLIYVDDGASPRSAAGQIAGAQSMPFAKADVAVDAFAAPQELDQALARLELLARENGSAVGMASAQSAAVARIANWAKQVESRGFVLVPISMVAQGARPQRAAARSE
jgi:polysaccharide deacetylase 2 family uncharacterized protein YibQ